MIGWRAVGRLTPEAQVRRLHRERRRRLSHYGRRGGHPEDVAAGQRAAGALCFGEYAVRRWRPGESGCSMDLLSIDLSRTQPGRADTRSEHGCLSTPMVGAG